MEEEIRNVEEPNEIDIIGIFMEIFSHWRKLLVWVAVAAVVGLIVAFSIPKTYNATTKLASEVVQKGGASSMSSLAALAGVNIGTSNTDAMYPDLYPEIIKSNPFRAELFSMPVRLMVKDEQIDTDLYDYVINYTRQPWWNAVLSVPSKLIGKLSWILHGKPDVKHGYEDMDPYKLTGEQSMALRLIGDCITITVEKKTFLITITATAQDPRVAADLCKVVTDNLTKYVVNYRTEKSRHDLEYYQMLYEQAQQEYFDAQQRYARYVDANQGVVFQRVIIERDRLQQEANLKYQVYNSTAQQVQQAKNKVQLETPVCTVIQPPTVPRKEAKPSKGKILLAFMFLSFCLGAVWYQWLAPFIESRRKRKAELNSAGND